MRAFGLTESVRPEDTRIDLKNCKTETLRHVLVTSTVRPKHLAQPRAVLDEAPLSVLFAALAEIELENGAPRKATWQRMRQLAIAVACTREIWF